MNYNQLQRIKKQIKKIKIDLEWERKNATSISPQLSGQPTVKASKHSKVENTAIKIIELENRLKQLEEEYKKAIDSIPDTIDGNVIRLKIVYGLTWRYIAHIQTGNGNNYNSVRMSAIRYEW